MSPWDSGVGFRVYVHLVFPFLWWVICGYRWYRRTSFAVCWYKCLIWRPDRMTTTLARYVEQRPPSAPSGLYAFIYRRSKAYKLYRVALLVLLLIAFPVSSTDGRNRRRGPDTSRRNSWGRFKVSHGPLWVPSDSGERKSNLGCGGASTMAHTYTMAWQRDQAQLSAQHKVLSISSSLEAQGWRICFIWAPCCFQ